jgi:hypothetical protein
MFSAVFIKALFLFDNGISLTNVHWKQLYVPIQNTFIRMLRKFIFYFSSFQGTGLWPVFFLVGWDLSQQVLRPLLAYCTEPHISYVIVRP